MNPNTTPILTFVGKSGTGKTTFLEKLIPQLKAQGLRLAVLKHDAHDFQLDKPGKDTYRFTAAGADVVTISSATQFALMERPAQELPLEEIISRLPQVDLVLIEGYKRNPYPKIELHRAALHRPILTPTSELLAILTDEPLDLPVSQLSLENTEECVNLILDYLATFSPTFSENS
jgi:molybdopterin-guanine dinucleotide biosynthesis protein B